ncbi:MAG: trypsin-like peptidase domain-containing protein [bacterium]|nr:trypsin-like peptidase domain-containing protein [bacterium]
MSLYELPKFNFPAGLKKKKSKKTKSKILVLTVSLSVIFGFLAGAVSGGFLYFNYAGLAKTEQPMLAYEPQTSQEEAVINVVKESSPAVVSIVVTKDLPVYEQYFEYTPFGTNVRQQQKGTQKKELGQGSGFIVSEDGLILTNRHVVLDNEAEYTVFTNSGKKYPAKVIARDPVQDLAVLKIEKENKVDNAGNFVDEKFPILKLGNSDDLSSGQTVVAIGNALGEFRNTVSVGVISGLGRRITASDSSGAFVETLDNVIQTDAAINSGNSGGPLLNLKGEVVGINSAVVSGAQSIGFSVPINQVKRALDQVKITGKIIYPFIGIRYVLVNETMQEEKGLSVDYGVLILSGDSQHAVEPGSAAEKAGIKEGDIVLEFGGERITLERSLSDIILKYNPGDEVGMKILRSGNEMEVLIILGERGE